MTSTTQNPPKLIHIARYFSKKGLWHYLFLRKIESNRFIWHEEQSDGEIPTSVSGQNIEESLRLAARHWKNDSFTTVICGFRYTLPERDEHGINAYFHQMVASYSSMNGIYYDEELGNNCYVQNASQESYNLWKRLKAQQRL